MRQPSPGYLDILFSFTAFYHDFLVTVKVAYHECVIRTGQP